MARDPDLLVDRRQLKRRLAFWRLLAFAAAAAAVVALFARLSPLPGSSYIAVVNVDGIIVGDPYRERRIRDLARDGAVAALVVRIDSPGGTTFGSEALYEAIRTVGETRPVVAVMDGVATSGGYMAALAAERILARESTITGSIGVVFEATNFAGLMEDIGVESELVRSAPLKAEPNPFGRMSREARDATRQIVDDLHRAFVGMVAERRPLTGREAADLADGRVYTGAMAVENGLVDGLGGVDEAVAWLEDEAGVAAGLRLNEVSVRRPGGLIDRLVSAAFEKSVIAERLRLDGVVSLWHPSRAD